MKRIILLLSSVFFLCGFVSVEHKNYVDAQFEVLVPQKIAYEVLTDYDNLPKFISSMLVSKILFRHENYVQVEQEATGKVFLLKKRMHITLEINEFPDRIEFEDILHKDFDTYKGYWQLITKSNSTIVIYHLISKPKFSVPFSKHVMKRNISKLLNEVEQEMLRRQNNGK